MRARSGCASRAAERRADDTPGLTSPCGRAAAWPRPSRRSGARPVLSMETVSAFVSASKKRVSWSMSAGAQAIMVDAIGVKVMIASLERHLAAVAIAAAASRHLAVGEELERGVGVVDDAATGEVLEQPGRTTEALRGRSSAGGGSLCEQAASRSVAARNVVRMRASLLSVSRRTGPGWPRGPGSVNRWCRHCRAGQCRFLPQHQAPSPRNTAGESLARGEGQEGKSSKDLHRQRAASWYHFPGRQFPSTTLRLRCRAAGVEVPRATDFMITPVGIATGLGCVRYESPDGAAKHAVRCCFPSRAAVRSLLMAQLPSGPGAEAA